VSAGSACLFCKIAAGEIPATIVHTDDEIVAFRDLNPQAPTHVLVIPRRHVDSLNGAEPKDAALLGRLMLAARAIAEREGVAMAGYRVVNNCGASGGQTVFHIHLHLLGGRPMAWPPG
jgi:histidine triad (HIT) family protein